MAEVIRRKTTTYRWFCTNKERLEYIDEQLEKLVYCQSKLSSYVEHNEIDGLQCLDIDAKFTWSIKELREERKTLWRRVPKITEEEVVADNVAPVEPVEKYTSPFAPQNMERL